MIFITTCIGSSSLFGAVPSAISIAVIPSDQISALISYPSYCSMTSGAIQQGDPTNVNLLFPGL